MKTDLTHLLNEILAWPARDQAELADHARRIRARQEHAVYVSDASGAAPTAHAVRTAADRQIETFWQRRGG